MGSPPAPKLSAVQAIQGFGPNVVPASRPRKRAALASFDQNRAARQASLDLAEAQLKSAEAVLEKAEHDQERMIERLHAVADVQLGEHWLDPDRRSIPGHWHVHARPKGRFNGWT